MRNKKNLRKGVVLPRWDIYESFTTLQLCPGKVYLNLLKDLLCWWIFGFSLLKYLAILVTCWYTLNYVIEENVRFGISMGNCLEKWMMLLKFLRKSESPKAFLVEELLSLNFQRLRRIFQTYFASNTFSLLLSTFSYLSDKNKINTTISWKVCWRNKILRLTLCLSKVP